MKFLRIGIFKKINIFIDVFEKKEKIKLIELRQLKSKSVNFCRVLQNSIHHSKATSPRQHRWDESSQHPDDLEEVLREHIADSRRPVRRSIPFCACMRAYVLDMWLYRSVVTLRCIMMKRHVECSSGVYDERWWLNELPRALRCYQATKYGLPRWCSWTKLPIGDIDASEAVTNKIVSLSTCIQVWLEIEIIVNRDNLERSSRVSSQSLSVSFRAVLNRWTDQTSTFRLLHQKISG